MQLLGRRRTCGCAGCAGARAAARSSVGAACACTARAAVASSIAAACARAAVASGIAAACARAAVAASIAAACACAAVASGIAAVCARAAKAARAAARSRAADASCTAAHARAADAGARHAADTARMVMAEVRYDLGRCDAARRHDSALRRAHVKAAQIDLQCAGRIAEAIVGKRRCTSITCIDGSGIDVDDARMKPRRRLRRDGGVVVGHDAREIIARQEAAL